MAALRVKNNDESGLYMFVCVKNRAPRLNSLTSLSSLTELMERMATKRNPSATDQIPRYLRNNCKVKLMLVNFSYLEGVRSYVSEIL